MSLLGTVFNLPNNVEVLMEVSNIDGGSGSEQNAGNENNNNGNTRKLITSNYAFLRGGDFYLYDAFSSYR